MKKISSSIILSISICVLVVSLLVGVMNSYISYGAIKEEAEARLKAMSGKYANQIDLQLLEKENIVAGMSNYFIANYNTSFSRNFDYNQKFMDRMYSYIETVLNGMPGNTILQMYAYINAKNTTNEGKQSLRGEEKARKEIIAAINERGKKKEFNPQQEYESFAKREGSRWDFYNEAVKNKAATWLTPYYDENFKCRVISYTTPIIIDNKLYGVVGLLIPFKDFADVVNVIRPYETGYAFMVDSSNAFMVHKKYDNTMKLEDTEYRSLAKRIENSKEGLYRDHVKGKTSYIAYRKLENGSLLAIVARQREVLNQVYVMVRNSFFFIILCIFVCSLIALVIGKKIAKPIQQVTKDLIRTREGDFTGQLSVKYRTYKNETGQLARALESLQGFMQRILSQIDTDSKKVSTSSDQLADTIYSLVGEVGNITSTVEELSAGMQQTESTASLLNESSEKMIGHVSKMNQNSSSGLGAANEIRERAIALRQEAMSSASKADVVCAHTQEKLRGAIEDSRQVNRINELTTAILNIAEQTNLLSLNASIEAARAGESGKGFTVVADEIRKLADNSQNTALEIQEITKNVILSVNKLCDSSNEVLDFMETNVKEIYQKLIETSEQYNKDSKDIKELFEDATNISKEIYNEIEVLLKAFNELTNATTEGVKGIQCISENAEEVSSHTRNVEQEANQLTGVAKELEEMVEVFTV